MQKKELRVMYKNLRNNISKDEIENHSLAIANKLIRLPIWENNVFHIFLPIEEQNEVNTEFILHLLSGKDKDIVLSQSNFEDCSMKHFLLTDNTKIKKNKYNIPEPTGGIEVDPKNIDVIIMPLLAFDFEGNRVGYGKGFYDKFISNCKKDVLKIGLSFFEPVASISDLNPNDVPLDYAITPNHVYQFD